MTSVQYDGATGIIAAFGQFDSAPVGLLLGYVLDPTPLSQPGSKRLVRGLVEVTPPPPPPPPTAEEIAEQQAAQSDRDGARQAIAQLLADAATLEGAGAITAVQQRAMLARTDRALVALARTLRRQGSI